MTATLDTAYGDGRFETLVTSGAPTDDLGREGDVAIDCASAAKNLYKKIDGTWVLQCALDSGGGGGPDTTVKGHGVLPPPLRYPIGPNQDIEDLDMQAITDNGLLYVDSIGTWILPANKTYLLRAITGMWSENAVGATQAFIQWVDNANVPVGSNNMPAFWEPQASQERFRAVNVVATALVTVGIDPLQVKLRTTADTSPGFELDSLLVEIYERFDELPEIIRDREVAVLNMAATIAYATVV